jgi:hypothetical protein
MYRHLIVPAVIATLTAISSTQGAMAFNLGYSRGLAVALERIEFNAAAVAPFAHARACVRPADQFFFN